jgi:hypothetical protein
MADCAPVDDGCAPVQAGSDDAATDAAADAADAASAPDAAGAADAADASADGPPSD